MAPGPIIEAPTSTDITIVPRTEIEFVPKVDLDITLPGLDGFQLGGGTLLEGSNGQNFGGGTLKLFGDSSTTTTGTDSGPTSSALAPGGIMAGLSVFLGGCSAADNPLFAIIPAAAVLVGVAAYFLGKYFQGTDAGTMQAPPLGRQEKVMTPLTPRPNGLPLAVSDSPSLNARMILMPGQNGQGLVIVDGPVGAPIQGGISINGRPMAKFDGTPLKWAPVGEGDVIEVDGKSYVIATPPSSAAQVNNGIAAKPADVVTKKLDGRNVSGSLRKSEGKGSSDASFRTTTDASGRTTSVYLEGRGTTASMMVQEADLSVSQGLGSKTLDRTVADARLSAGDFLSVATPLRAPQLDGFGLEITPRKNDLGNATGLYDAKFAKDGEIEAIVVRLGGGNTPVFEAADGISSPSDPLTKNDIVIAGRFSKVMSKETVMAVVKEHSGESAQSIRDALQLEARIRTEILSKVEPGELKFISERDYKQAYSKMTGKDPVKIPERYQSNYMVNENGDVVETRNINNVVDHFTKEPTGFLVQTLGE